MVVVFILVLCFCVGLLTLSLELALRFTLATRLRSLSDLALPGGPGLSAPLLSLEVALCLFQLVSSSLLVSWSPVILLRSPWDWVCWVMLLLLDLSEAVCWLTSPEEDEVHTT